jgi:predicted TIM-barrel fold metal-dependent hydrolase
MHNASLSFVGRDAVIAGVPVIDAVVHPFDFSEANFANRHGSFISDLVVSGTMANSPPGYDEVPKAAYLRDWGVEEIAAMSFVEAYTDLAVYHVLPIKAFKDGACGIEKAVEARRRWPGRFLFYVGVDPMEGDVAVREMEEQYERLEGDVIGLKLYPNSWVTGDIEGWLMDDPEIAFPVFAKAREMGLRNVAVHKAIPLGPVELKHYRVDDIDRAAMEFPELNFEVVHGGVSFLEESAWQLNRFPNVYVNLESTSILAFRRRRAWEHILAAFLRVPGAAKKLLWASGCIVSHPRPAAEAFMAFQFADDLIEAGDVAPITDADKRDIFAGNYARISGIDLDARLAAIAGDEWAQRRPDGTEPAPPFSTTNVAAFA